MQATCITVFVFSSIFLSSLAIAFARPWNGKHERTQEICNKKIHISDCIVPDIPDASVTEKAQVTVVPIATNGEKFPWDNVR